MTDDDHNAKRLAAPSQPDMTDDSPEWTEEMFARARPAREVLGNAFVDAWEIARGIRWRP